MMRIHRASLALLARDPDVQLCAGILRNPDIADVRRNSGHYSDRTVTFDVYRHELVGRPLCPSRCTSGRRNR